MTMLPTFMIGSPSEHVLFCMSKRRCELIRKFTLVS